MHWTSLSFSGPVIIKNIERYSRPYRVRWVVSVENQAYSCIKPYGESLRVS